MKKGRCIVLKIVSAIGKEFYQKKVLVMNIHAEADYHKIIRKMR